MSGCNDEGGACAACGKAGDGLKKCAACKTVKYCSRDCQSSHRSAHKAECKKHKARLFQEKLFAPPPLADECPICFLRLSWDCRERQYMPCCGKVICSGCIVACGDAVGWDRKTMDIKCPFCRNPSPDPDQLVYLVRKRAEQNDAEATIVLAGFYRGGYQDVVEKDDVEARRLYQKAAGMGNAMAHYIVGLDYLRGEGVKGRKDVEKHVHHMQVAAIAGHYMARDQLGSLEVSNLNMEGAVKHWMIAAAAGYEESLDKIRRDYASPHLRWVTKEQYETALRSYQKASYEMKSEQRDIAAALNPDAGKNPIRLADGESGPAIIFYE